MKRHRNSTHITQKRNCSFSTTRDTTEKKNQFHIITQISLRPTHTQTQTHTHSLVVGFSFVFSPFVDAATVVVCQLRRTGCPSKGRCPACRAPHRRASRPERAWRPVKEKEWVMMSLVSSISSTQHNTHTKTHTHTHTHTHIHTHAQTQIVYTPPAHQRERQPRQSWRRPRPRPSSWKTPDFDTEKEKKKERRKRRWGKITCAWFFFFLSFLKDNAANFKHKPGQRRTSACTDAQTRWTWQSAGAFATRKMNENK